MPGGDERAGGGEAFRDRAREREEDAAVLRAAGVSAFALEGGGEDVEGSFGDGEGKWRVTVSADRALHVLSLVRSRWGYLASLSP